jgi:hypothetical protein
MARGEAEGGAKPVRLCPCSSDVNLFSYGQGIIDFNTEAERLKRIWADARSVIFHFRPIIVAAVSWLS